MRTNISQLKRIIMIFLMIVMVITVLPPSFVNASTSSTTIEADQNNQNQGKSIKEQLQELLDYASTLDSSDYTAESWSPVNILLTGIKANIDNEEMLSQYGEQWLSTLEQKLDELVPAEKSIKEQLQELLDYASTLDSLDYTAESWSPVNILLTGIKANIDNEEMLSQYGEQWLNTLKQKLDELIPIEDDSSDDGETDFEKGVYKVPVKGYGNINYEGQTDSALYPYGMLEVKDNGIELTIRLQGYSAFDNFFVLRQKYINEYISSDNKKEYAPNASGIDDSNQSKQQWIADGRLSEEENDYYIDKSKFEIELDESLDYADITIPLENTYNDTRYVGYPEYVSSDSQSKNIRGYYLNIGFDSAEKIQIPEEGEYTWNIIADAGSTGLNISNDETTDKIQALLSEDGMATAIVQGDTATVEMHLNEDVEDVKILKKRTLSGYAGTLSARFNTKSSRDSDYETVVQESNKVIFSVDLSSYKDLVFGKSILISAKTEQKNLYSIISFVTSGIEKLNLIDNNTGLSYETDSTNVAKETVFKATELTEENSSYATYEKFFGTSYAEWMGWYTKLEKDGNEILPKRNGTLSIPLPAGWNTELIHLFRVNAYGNYEEQDITIENDVITVQASQMGTYILCVERDYSTDGSQLEDGTYSIDVAVWNMIQDQPSMADQGVKSPAKLVVKNGKKILYLGFEAVSNLNLSSYMTHMWVYGSDVSYSEAGYPQGDKYAVTAYEYYRNDNNDFLTDDFNKGSLNYYPKQIYFELPNDDSEFPVRFRVPVMDAIGGGDFAQDARFRIDYSTAKLISTATPDAPIKDALGEMISIAETAVKEEYTPATWSVLEEAYKTAKDVYEKNASTEEMETTYTSLRDAVDALEKPEAMELEPGVYTVEDSFDQGDGVTQTRLLVSENETKVYFTLNGVKEFYYYDTENAQYTEPELETSEDGEGNQVIERAVITYASTPSLISVKYLAGDNETVTGSLTLNDCTKQEVTKEALAAALEQANKIIEAAAQTPEDYDGEKVDALVQAVAASTKVNSDPVAIQTEVDEQVSVLEKAAAEASSNTEEERTALEATITAANREAAKEDVYTASSINELKDLIASAQELLNGTPTASELEAMTLRIQAFLEEGLILKADFSELQALYDTAVKTAENADESYSGYTNLTEIIKQAETILNNGDASQSEVDSMAEALTLAISALDDSVEKGDLRGLVEQAEKLISDGNYQGCTQATQELLNASLEAARAVLADPAATQSEVNKHYDMLQAADAAMVKEKTGLADGIYEADATILHAADTDGTQLSMANSAVDKPVQVIVENGVPKAIRLSFHALTTTGLTGYLGNLWYFPGYRDAAVPNGQTPVQAEVETWYTDEEIGEDPYADYMDGKQYPKSMLIPIESDGNGVYYTEYWIQVFVPVMESINTGSGTQYARLKLEIDDWSDMKQISGTENADKEELQKQLQVLKDFLEAISEEDADPSTEDFRTEDLAVLETAITAGTAADENMNIGQELVDSTVKALAAAETLFASESIESDKTALNEAIAKAEEALGLENVVYTEASRQNLEWILNAAKVVAGNVSAEQAQITWWTTRLEQAVENLALISADKTELAAALETAEERLKETDLYTGASLDILRSLYERAQELYDNAGSTQEDIDKYVAMLNYYVESMVPVQEGETFRDGLYSMLLTASNMAGRENSFTDSTLNALKAAIKAADAVYQDEDATQAEINEQASKLYYAILALEAKPAETPGTGTGDGGSGNDNNDDGNNDGNTDLDIENLADGVYSIYGEMVKTDKTSESMSNAAVNHTIKLSVEDGKYYITMNFNGLQYAGQYGYLKDLQYFLTGYTTNQYGVPQGDLADVTIDSYQTDSDGNRISDSFGTDYPDYVTFELIPEALEDGFVPLQVFVPIMESIADGTGTQAVYLKLDWSSLKLTEADDPDFEDDGNNDNNNNNNGNGNGGSGLSGGSGLGNNTLGSTLGGSSLGGSSLGGSSLGGSSLGGSSLKSGSSLTGASSVKTDDISSDISGWAAVLAIGCMALLVGVLEKRSQKKNKGM